MKTITVANKTGTIYGASRSKINDGVREGFQRWIKDTEQTLGVAVNVRFEFVTSGRADYEIYSKVNYAGRRNGKHTHSRGVANIGGRKMWLHNGTIPAGQGNKQSGSYKWKPFTSVRQIAKIVAHEFGHNLGLRHTGDRSCTMHPDASAAVICKSEAEFFERRFGSNQQQPVEPKTDYGIIKQGTKLGVLNIPVVGQGSFDRDDNGNWTHIENDSIVVLNATVHSYQTNCCYAEV